MYALLAAILLMHPPHHQPDANVRLRGGPFNGYTAKGGPAHLVFPRSVPFSPDRNQGTPVDDARNTTVDDIYEKTNAFDASGLRVYKFAGTEIR